MFLSDFCVALFGICNALTPNVFRYGHMSNFVKRAARHFCWCYDDLHVWLPGTSPYDDFEGKSVV